VYPSEVSGLVLLDASHEDFYTTVSQLSSNYTVSKLTETDVMISKKMGWIGLLSPFGLDRLAAKGIEDGFGIEVPPKGVASIANQRFFKVRTNLPWCYKF
jgi:hypothetical protein